MEQVEENVSRYMEELDRADPQPALVPRSRVQHIKENIASPKDQSEGFNELNKQLRETLDQQILLVVVRRHIR